MIMEKSAKKAISGVLTCIFCLFILFVSACENKSEDSNKDATSDMGSIAFSLIWPGTEQSVQTSTARSFTSEDVCVDFDVETIWLRVTDQAGSEFCNNSPGWSCSAHQGEIHEVPPGSGRHLIIEGTVSGEVRWRGEYHGAGGLGQNQTQMIVRQKRAA